MDLDSLTMNTPLPLLGPHLPTLVVSTVAFFLIRSLTAIYGPVYLGKKWEAFDGRTKKGMASHVVCTLLPSFSHEGGY